MGPATFLYRQINPSWVQAGRVTSQAFRPTPKDNDLLSVYNGDLITAEGSWQHFADVLGLASAGTLAVTVGECVELLLPARPDPEPFREHAVIDFTGKTKSERKRASEILRGKAQARGWQFERPAG